MLSPVVKLMMSVIREQCVCSMLWKENKTHQQKPHHLENEHNIVWVVSKSGKKSIEIEGHPARFSDRGIYMCDLSEYLLGMNWQISRNQNDSLRRTESIRQQTTCRDFIPLLSKCFANCNKKSFSPLFRDDKLSFWYSIILCDRQVSQRYSWEKARSSTWFSTYRALIEGET
jgi:hypothetical protein